LLLLITSKVFKSDPKIIFMILFTKVKSESLIDMISLKSSKKVDQFHVSQSLANTILNNYD